MNYHQSTDTTTNLNLYVFVENDSLVTSCSYMTDAQAASKPGSPLDGYWELHEPRHKEMSWTDEAIATLETIQS